MFKIITHVLVFAVGAGAGVYWGVNHPSQAQNVANVEQAKIDQVKQAAQKVTNQAAPAPVATP